MSITISRGQFPKKSQLGFLFSPCSKKNSAFVIFVSNFCGLLVYLDEKNPKSKSMIQTQILQKKIIGLRVMKVDKVSNRRLKVANI